MYAFILCFAAIAITGGSIASENIFGIALIYIILGTLFISYVYIFATKGKALPFGPPEKCLFIFVGWGLFCVALSLAGINQLLKADLIYNLKYLPRQAIYLFVLPAALLFREDQYTKTAELFLKKYGEGLFWVLYFAQMLYFNMFMLTVLTQVLLCWLSLFLETKQGWRRWIRIAALLLTPMFEAGQTTILIIRILFFAVCIIPKYWSRIAYRLMAIGMLGAIIGCFILPVAFEDTIFSDFNMAWRMRTWKDSEAVLANTHYLGAGYGTSYQSEEYIQGTFQRNEFQYREKDGYTREERKFVTAPHNSYISVAMRTGIVGVALFILFLILLFRNLIRHRSLPSKASCFALFAGAALIMFNVGLESPGYLMTFVFCIGACVREGKKLQELDLEAVK